MTHARSLVTQRLNASYRQPLFDCNVAEHYHIKTASSPALDVSPDPSAWFRPSLLLSTLSPSWCGVYGALDCPKREFKLRRTPDTPLDDVAPSSGQSQDAGSQFFFFLQAARNCGIYDPNCRIPRPRSDNSTIGAPVHSNSFEPFCDGLLLQVYARSLFLLCDTSLLQGIPIFRTYSDAT